MLLNNDISVIKLVMILYLFVFANVISTKINTKIIYRIENNVMIKHIVGLITIGVLLSLVYSSIPLKDLILYSLIIYVVFILSTKISKNYVLLALLLLVGVYFLSAETENRIKGIKNDQSIHITEKSKLITHLESKNNKITYFYIFAVVIGSLMYDEKKFVQMGGSYDLVNFLN
jgi:hypothetical protein